MGIWGLKGHLKNPGQHNPAGQPFQVEAITENNRLLPKVFLKLLIKTNQPPQNENILINLPSKGTCNWHIRLTYPQRGHYKLGPLVAEVTDPFGLFRLHRILDKGQDILIYPATVELPLFWAESPAESGLLWNSWLTNEAGGAISGVREYIPGDSLNRIHWRSTAHTGKLIVKEFDVDSSKKVWVVLDLCRDSKFGTGIETTEEYGITIAASIVKKYADAGRQVGLIAQGKDYHFYAARPGDVNMWRIMEALANLKANGQIPLYRLLDRAHEQFNCNSAAVIITASASDELVATIIRTQRRGIQPITILLDATSFGGDISPQSTETRLRASNIPSYIIRQGDDLKNVLNSQEMNATVKSGSKVHYIA
jgi:uncharacterized protein (DUF58 family)